MALPATEHLHDAPNNGPQSIYDLARSLGITNRRWHILAAVDGSGTSFPNPIGYAGVLCYNSPFSVKIVLGSSSAGASQEAEVKAVLELASYALKNRPKNFDAGIVVHFLTDSQYVHSMMNKFDPIKMYNAKAHGHLWQVIAHARRQGVIMQSHLRPRNSNLLMVCADHLSRTVRQNMDEIKKQEIMSYVTTTVFDTFHPDSAFPEKPNNDNTK